MEIDFLNPRSIICLIAILQGLVFAGLLGVRFIRRRERADLWLAILLLTFCSSLITPMIGFANVYDLNQWLTYFPFSIYYSAGALVWLYTRNLTNARLRFELRDALLFLPSLIYLGIRLFLFAHDLEWKNWFGSNYGSSFSTFVFVTELIWNLSLLGLSIAHYRRYRLWLNDNFSDTEKIKFDWLRNFLYFFTAFLLLGAAFDFVNSFVVKLSYIQFFYFELVLALATYALATAGYLRSKTIVLDFADKALETTDDVLPDSSREREIEPLKRKILGIIDDEKIYLEPDITLGEFARRLGVNTSLLSYAINSGFGRNFNDFINGFRIDEVRRRLTRGDSGETMLEIALACGFNSKATFNRAFKKFTGVSPTEYQANSGKDIYV